MWALAFMLLGLAIGLWREGLGAAIVLGFFFADMLVLGISQSIQLSVEFGIATVLAMLSFPAVIIPLAGLLYLTNGNCRGTGKLTQPHTAAG